MRERETETETEKLFLSIHNGWLLGRKFKTPVCSINPSTNVKNVSSIELTVPKYAIFNNFTGDFSETLFWTYILIILPWIQLIKVFKRTFTNFSR